MIQRSTVMKTAIKMLTLEHEERWLAFVSAINQEASSGTDRGLVLVCGSMIDAALGELLSAFLIDHGDVKELLNGVNKPLNGFSNRINMAFALGLIRVADRTALHTIRDIRNEAAHHIAFELAKTRNLTRLEASYKATGAQNSKDNLRARFLHLSIFSIDGLDIATQTVGNKKRKIPDVYGLNSN